MPQANHIHVARLRQFPPAYKDVYRDRQEQADDSEYNYRVHILNLNFSNENRD
jgi:hypothetical protein